MSEPTTAQKRVFITGAQGFLGKHTAKLFQSRGWHVVGLGRQSLPTGGYKAWGIDTHFTGNIAPYLLHHAHQETGPPDVIVHAAGASSVGQTAEDPYGELSHTVGATAAVVEYMRDEAPKGHFIYVSSAAVYGNICSKLLAVDAPLQPISMYGLHKQLCENITVGARSICGLESSIVRFFSLYGPGLTKQLLWDVVRRVSAGEAPLRLGGTGEETRDFMYVEDAARLIVHIAEQKQQNIVVNGATGNATSVDEIVRLVIKYLSPEVKIEYSNVSRPGDPKHLLADISGFESLGFTSQTSLQDGVAAYVDWARQEIGFDRQK